MENKHNLNYFKKSGWQKPIGAGLFIAGILLFLFGWTYFSYIFSIIFILLGVALFLIGSSLRATDSDIDEFIRKNLADFNVTVEQDKIYARRVLKHIPREEIEAYKYDEGLMFTKTKTGTLRSSEYVKSIIYVLSDSLYISSRSISIVSGEIGDKVYEISYLSLKSVQITRSQKTLTYLNKKFEANDTRLHIECEDGSIIDLPLPDTLAADQLVEKIKNVRDNFIS